MFIVDESTTDLHVTFVERFPINIRNATNYIFRVAQGTEAFEIKIQLDDIEGKYGGYVGVSIQMLRSQQETVDLFGRFSIEESDRGWNSFENSSLKFSLNDTHTFSLALIEEEKNVLNNGGILTINMTGSYLIHSLHILATSHVKFDAKAHASANMSHSWTVCNLSLPFYDLTCLVSETVFVGLGVPEFHITMQREIDLENFLRVYSEIKNMVKRPFRIQNKFEPIVSNNISLHVFSFVLDDSGNYKVCKKEYKRYTRYIWYKDFVNPMQQCATLKYHVLFEQL